jgi:ankyrin repeat protein
MRTHVFVMALALAVAQASPAVPQEALDPELAKGIRLVDEAEFEAAVTSLNAVVRTLVARGNRPLELSRAYLYLAIAHLGLSQEQAAKAKFVEALRSDRDLTLSTNEFPPPVVEIFDQVKRSLATPPPPRPSTPSRPPVPPDRMFEAVRLGDFSTLRGMLADDPSLAKVKDQRFGGTALHWAALKGHQAIVALLIAEGADLKAVNNDGETALQVAERAGKPEIVALLRPAAGPFTASGGIFGAVKSGDAALVKKLVAENPKLVGLKDTGFGATPLHWAALKGHDAVVEALLAAGANASAPNREGETPLEVAERAKKASTVAILRRGGGTGGTTSLEGIFAAARDGDVQRVNALITKDPAAVNTKDARFGATPLHWAALKGHEAVVDLLLANGANPKAVNKDGETPVQVAKRAGQAAVLPYFAPGGGSATAGLVEAVKAGDLSRVQKLLQDNPRLINQKDASYSATPLHYAALKGNVEMVKLLVARGADPKAVNRDGETPLQVARRGGKTNVVAVLTAP